MTSWDSVVCSGWFLLKFRLCCLITLLRLLLCKQKKQSTSLVYSEYLDIWLLGSSVYWEVSMTRFSNSASGLGEFGHQWVN